MSHQWLESNSFAAGDFRFCENCDREEWSDGTVREGLTEVQKAMSESHQTPTGKTVTFHRNGSKLVIVTGLGTGGFSVACYIDYGNDGRSYCEGGTYKTNAGATRRTNNFLGVKA